MAEEGQWTEASDPTGWKGLMGRRYGPAAHGLHRLEQKRVIRAYSDTISVSA